MKFLILIFSVVCLCMFSGCSGGHKNAVELANKAYLFALNGDWKQALDFSKRAVNSDSSCSDARILYALALDNAGKKEEALEEISRVLAQEPEDFFALYTKGRLLYTLGRYESCIQPLNSALKLRPKDPNVLLLLAQSARKMNDLSSAKNYYSRLAALPIYRKSQPVWNELGVTLILNRWPAAKAEPYIKYAYSLNRNNPTLLLNMAVLYDQYIPRRSTAAAFYAQYLRVTADNSALAEKRAVVKARLKTIR